jgi:glycosyltransferase involved in cell wall biosynthesis
MRAAVVIPNWNGARWLVGCLDAVAAQGRPFDEVVVVDGASSDDSLEILAAHPLAPRVVRLDENLGFGAASNRGIAAVDADFVALVNTDVVLAPEWLERAMAALDRHPEAAAVATKMVALDDPGRLDDTGDFLGRDGAAIQRGKRTRDTGRWDAPEEVWGACAGAALYRRAAVLDVGGFDERFFMYLEDVDLSLTQWVARNTLLLVAKAFPVRWAPFVLYRQVALAWHAARERALRAHLAGLAAALPLLPAMWRERSRLRRSARVPIDRVIPAHPIRGPRPLGAGVGESAV